MIRFYWRIHLSTGVFGVVISEEILVGAAELLLKISWCLGNLMETPLAYSRWLIYLQGWKGEGGYLPRKERGDVIDDPKRPVCPVLGTAGLTQAFFGGGRAGLWESGFPKPKRNSMEEHRSVDE